MGREEGRELQHSDGHFLTMLLESHSTLIDTEYVSSERHERRHAREVASRGKLECYHPKKKKEMIGGYIHLMCPILWQL